MNNRSFAFYGLRKKETISMEIRRPMCWLAIGVIFLFGCLFWGRSYNEVPDLKDRQNVYVEGNIVSKEYKTSSYGGDWQIVLQEVKISYDAMIEKDRKDAGNKKIKLENLMEDTEESIGIIEGIGSKKAENSVRHLAALEGKYICQLEQNEEDIWIGQKVLLFAEFEPWEEVTNPGQFDMKKWYCSQGILGQFKECRIMKRGSQYSLLRESMWRLRTWLYGCLREELGEKEGSLIGAMLLGEKSGLEEGSKSLYQRNGISHVLSISGLHLTLLGMGVFVGLKHIFGNNNAVAVICIIVMVLYCIFTGSAISTIRATVMFIISFLAQILGRSYDSLSALGLSAVLQLIFNPYTLNNSSFLLSFLAVVGVTFVSPRLQQILGAKKKLAKAFCVSLSASLVTLPVLLRDYGTYPWYSTILNLFIVPVMSILLGLSVLLVFFLLFIAGTMCFLKIKTAVMIISVLKTLVILGIKALLSYMEICCQIFEKLPLHDGYLGSPTVGHILIYVVLLLLVIGNVWRHSLFGKKMILLSAIMVLTARTEFGAELVMLDVGQGDSIVIRNSNRNIYLVDCGSSSVSQVGKYRLLPFLKKKGYGRIQGIFISHLDQDHMNGILELLQMSKEERIKIVQLFLPESVCKIEKDKEKLKEIVELAEKNLIKVVYLKQGDRITDGRMQFLCLHPNIETRWKTEQDRNNESLVLFLKYRNNNFLLTGDVEKEGEMEILQYIDSLGLSVKLDVLKVAHHGSNGSSSEKFLKTITPKLSLISSGRDNRYGHPHEETVERLEKTGSKIITTIESGAITLRIGKKIRVYEFRK